MSKSTVDRSFIRKLCTSQDELTAHVQQKLQNRQPRSYVFSRKKAMPAAVLIPLFFKQGKAHLLFTKRSNLVEHHKGQISFPGGRRDESDADLQFTALRETEEEVGIRPEHIRIVGQTDRFLTNTYFMVSPFVGFFDYPYSFEVSEAEIERLIEVPLIHLIDEAQFEVKPFTKNGYTWMVHYYRYQSDVIWGVTGFLLSNFLSIVFGCERDVFNAPHIKDKT